jgi:hypothetical protein
VPLLATFDPFALSKAAGSSQPTSSWTLGLTAGNRMKVFTGKWALIAPKLAAQDSIATYGLEGTLGAGASGATTREVALLFD